MPVRVDKFLISKVFDLKVWHSSPRFPFWSGNKCKVRMLENFCKLKQSQWEIQNINGRSERTYEDNGMLYFFSKIYKNSKLQDWEERIFTLNHILPWLWYTVEFLTPCKLYRECFKCLPQILFLTILFSRTSKSLSMGVFVDGS